MDFLIVKKKILKFLSWKRAEKGRKASDGDVLVRGLSRVLRLRGKGGKARILYSACQLSSCLNVRERKEKGGSRHLELLGSKENHIPFGTSLILHGRRRNEKISQLHVKETLLEN